MARTSTQGSKEIEKKTIFRNRQRHTKLITLRKLWKKKSKNGKYTIITVNEGSVCVCVCEREREREREKEGEIQIDRKTDKILRETEKKIPEIDKRGTIIL